MRFSIRDVLWLTALVAALVGWGVDRTVLARRARQLQTEAAAWKEASENFWLSLVNAAHYIAALKEDSTATRPADDPYWKMIHEQNSK